MVTRRARREKIGKVLKFTAAVALTGAVVYFLYGFQPTPHSDRMQEFFSDDDGATWFADDGTRIAPFDHNGKQAVLVKVFETPSGKPFVAYEIKFTDEAAKQISEAQTNHSARMATAPAGAASSQLLVKKPHDKEWIPDSDPRAADIRKVVGPDGSNACLPVRP